MKIKTTKTNGITIFLHLMISLITINIKTSHQFTVRITTNMIEEILRQFTIKIIIKMDMAI